MLILAHELCAIARQGGEVLAGRRQQDADPIDPVILAREIERFQKNTTPQAKRLRCQHQPEIPDCALFLEPAPADIAIACMDRPMPSPSSSQR